MNTTFLIAKPFAVRWFLFEQNPDAAKASTLPSVLALRLFWFAVTTACNSQPSPFDEDLYTFSLQEFSALFPEPQQIRSPEIRKAVHSLPYLMADFDGNRSYVFGSEEDSTEKGRGNSIWMPDGNHIHFYSEFILEDNLFRNPENVTAESRHDYLEMDYRFIAGAPARHAKAVIALYPLYLSLDRYLSEVEQNPATLDSDFLLASGGYAPNAGSDGYAPNAGSGGYAPNAESSGSASPIRKTYSFAEFKAAFFGPGWTDLNNLLGKDIQFDAFRIPGRGKGRCAVLFHRGLWSREYKDRIKVMLSLTIFQ